MKITCVTSRYLPNLRHIARLLEVDTTVILDLAPLPHRNRDSFIYRNRIMNKFGDKIWLSVPVSRKGTNIVKDAKIELTKHNWTEKHIKSLSHFYPKHNLFAGNFLEKMQESIMLSDGTLLDVNTKMLSLILETLGYQKVNFIYQSELINCHSDDHRLDLANILKAHEYIAGQVEYKILSDRNKLLQMQDSGVIVNRSPDLSIDEFSKDLTVELSCIHSIFTLGIDKTREILDRMLSKLKKHQLKSV
jgi:hypothetical protein